MIVRVTGACEAGMCHVITEGSKQVAQEVALETGQEKPWRLRYTKERVERLIWERGGDQVTELGQRSLP